LGCLKGGAECQKGESGCQKGRAECKIEEEQLTTTYKSQKGNIKYLK